MADIAGLSVKLGLVTVEWDAATEKAKRQAKDLRSSFDNLGMGFSKAAELWKQFGSALAAGGFTALLAETAQFADEIVDVGKSFELTTQQVLAFRDAITSAGGKADSASKILATLYGKIDEGRQGNDKAIAQFEKLGLTFADLKKMDTYEAINKVAQGFNNINDAFVRTKMIKEFFGKGGIGLSIDQINSALAQGTKRYDEYAEGIQAVGVIADNVKRSMENLKIAIASMMKPFVGDGIVSIERFHQILQALAAGGIAFGIGKIAVAFFELGVAIRAAVTAGAAFNLAMGVTNPLGLAMKLLAAGATAIVFFSGQQDNAAKIAEMYNDNPAVKDKLAGDARSRLLFTKEPSGGGTAAATEVDNPELKSRKAQVALARQLKDIDAKRNQANADALINGEAQTKITLIQLSLSEKLAQIEAKRSADLLAAKDNTNAFKAQINAQANIEIATATQNAKAQEKAIEQAEKLSAIQRKAQEDARNYSDLAQSNQEMADYLAQQQLVSEQIRIQYADGLRNVQLANERTKYEMQFMSMASEKRAVLMEQYDLEARITEFVREQNKLGQDETVTKQRAEAMREAGNQTIALNEANREAQRSFEYGWSQAYNNFVDQSTNAAARAGDIFNSITGNMSNAIDTFVRTGKLSFKDFTRSVIQDLIAIQMKAQAMALFRMALGSFGFGGSGVDLGGSAYGGGTPGAVGFAAEGGDISGPTIVGEKGPELFIPNKSGGTVIPNNQLSNTLGGGQTVNYNGPFIAQMNAIDTQSGVQFLSKNKQAVWAANQSAQRSLPMSK